MKKERTLRNRLKEDLKNPEFCKDFDEEEEAEEYLRTATPGSVKVKDIVEHKDGSATIYFLIPNVTKKVIKEFYSVKRFTKKLFKKYVTESLIEAEKQCQTK